MRTTKVMPVWLPPDMFRAAERIAKREGRTSSELFREALRRYICDERWRRLREYGAEQSRRLGVTQSDVEQLIREYRQERQPARRR
jgi:metal-responsive CopG/Arc/MetJ family transcriptional regulator